MDPGLQYRLILEKLYNVREYSCIVCVCILHKTQFECSSAFQVLNDIPINK